MRNRRYLNEITYNQSYNFNKFITPITISLALFIIYYSISYETMSSNIYFLFIAVMMLYSFKIVVFFKRITIITNKRVIVKKGIYKQRKFIDIDDIIDINLYQNPFGKLFDYGDISIEYKYPGCFFKIDGVNTPSIMVANLEYLYELSKSEK